MFLLLIECYGHSQDFILSERNGHWGFSAGGWHSVTYTVKKNTLMDCQWAVEPPKMACNFGCGAMHWVSDTEEGTD